LTGASLERSGSGVSELMMLNDNTCTYMNMVMRVVPLVSSHGVPTTSEDAFVDAMSHVVAVVVLCPVLSTSSNRHIARTCGSYLYFDIVGNSTPPLQ